MKRITDSIMASNAFKILPVLIPALYQIPYFYSSENIIFVCHTKINSQSNTVILQITN